MTDQSPRDASGIRVYEAKFPRCPGCKRLIRRVHFLDGHGFVTCDSPCNQHAHFFQISDDLVQVVGLTPEQYRQTMALVHKIAPRRLTPKEVYLQAGVVTPVVPRGVQVQRKASGE